MVQKQSSPGRPFVGKKARNRVMERERQRAPDPIHGISPFFKQFCNIPHKVLALVYVDEQDKLRTLIPPASEHVESVPPQVKANFQRIIHLASQEGPNTSTMGDTFGGISLDSDDEGLAGGSGRPSTRKRAHRAFTAGSKSRHAKKRRKAKAPVLEYADSIKLESDEDSEPASSVDGPTSQSKGDVLSFRIDDRSALDQYYQDRFEQIQQKDCKTISKAWIKTIHPRKQSTHPYVKGWDFRPKWWPPSGCEHKEPDHLRKEHRIHLLKWILGLESVAVAKLEKSTGRRLEDKIKKYPLLKEVYRVAKKDEDYRNEELDGDTQIFVAATAKVLLKTDVLQSESDDDDGPGYSDSEPDTPHSSPGVTPPGASKIVSPVERIALGEPREEQSSTNPAITDSRESREKTTPARPMTMLHEGRPVPSDGGYQSHFGQPYLNEHGSNPAPSMGYQQNPNFDPRPQSVDLMDRPHPTYWSPPTSLFGGSLSGEFRSHNDIYASYASPQQSFSQLPGYQHVPAQDNHGSFSNHLMILPTTQAPDQRSLTDVRIPPQSFGHHSLHGALGNGSVGYAGQVQGQTYPSYINTDLSPNSSFGSFSAHSSNDHPTADPGKMEREERKAAYSESKSNNHSPHTHTNDHNISVTHKTYNTHNNHNTLALSARD
ncbi:MAG: hypothetical protein M1837_001257 [Sclerophora amabilis]|nr:MAG: hypothetical protein M1837_001257 [Sclerophora amabilis]